MKLQAGKKIGKNILSNFTMEKKDCLPSQNLTIKQKQQILIKKFNSPKLPEIRISRYGAYIQKEDDKQIENVNIPQDVLPSDLNVDYIEDLFKHKKTGNELGYRSQNWITILLLYGMYGSYLQLGISDNTKEKPKRVSIPKFLPFSEVGNICSSLVLSKL